MAKQTISEAHRKLDQLQGQISSMSDIIMDLQRKVSKLNEYMIVDIAVEADRKARNNGSIINKDLLNLIMKFLAALTVALGIISFLVRGSL